MSVQMDFAAAQEFSVKTRNGIQEMTEEQAKNLQVLRTVADESGLDSLKDAADKLEVAYRGFNGSMEEMTNSLVALQKEADQVEELNRA